MGSAVNAARDTDEALLAALSAQEREMFLPALSQIVVGSPQV
jgi:hypothetical protein